MPWDRKKYPVNWEAFSKEIRFKRAGGRCECTGQCGLHRTTGGPRRCVERDGQPGKWMKGPVMLTVAHLNHKEGPCRCEPRCADPEHVIAACQRCHLRIDHPRHVANARRTRHKRRAHRELFE